MEGFQKWTARHPVVFWISLIAVAIILGAIVSGEAFFLAAAAVSGGGWQYQALKKYPRPPRAARSLAHRRHAERVAVLPPLILPPGPHVLLPCGQKIQVTKEEHHLADVVPLLEDVKERHVAATLHRMPPASPRSSRERVQVRIDGSAVGELTLYMSEHFLPLIAVCDERGITVACRASVKGNQLKVDVVLDTTKAIDLGGDWIDDHVLDTGTGTI